MQQISPVGHFHCWFHFCLFGHATIVLFAILLQCLILFYHSSLFSPSHIAPYVFVLFCICICCHLHQTVLIENLQTFTSPIDGLCRCEMLTLHLLLTFNFYCPTLNQYLMERHIPWPVFLAFSSLATPLEMGWDCRPTLLSWKLFLRPCTIKKNHLSFPLTATYSLTSLEVKSR